MSKVDGIMGGGVKADGAHTPPPPHTQTTLHTPYTHHQPPWVPSSAIRYVISHCSFKRCPSSCHMPTWVKDRSYRTASLPATRVYPLNVWACPPPPRLHGSARVQQLALSAETR